MPELPEVEVVRRGLERWAAGRPVSAVEVLDARSVRRHDAGPADFADRLTGARLAVPERRGKYLWIPLADVGPTGGGAAVADVNSSASLPADAYVSGPVGSTAGPGPDATAGPPAVLPTSALVAHLGMSGQLLISEPGDPDQRHLRVRLLLEPEGEEDRSRELRFVDQRIFGGLFLDTLVSAADRPEQLLPASVAHIGRDPLDPYVNLEAVHRRLRARKTGIKRALLDQGLVSGIGNIYADEALWRARLHYARPTETLNRTEADRLFEAVREVMEQALAQGGTSFDSLYVNVNGESGYFSRSLDVYGRSGKPCRRCGTAITRERFMNRSSHFCPVCQRKR